MKLIVITGTPGTGKSTLAKWLAKRAGFYRLDLSKYYPQISHCYNQKKQCYDVDLGKFERLVREKLKEKENLIVDSHIAHLLPGKLVDWCIVLTCSDLKKLEKRLKKRKYSKKKIQENLEAEIFQVCLQEAKGKGHRAVVIDAARENIQESVVRLLRQITRPGRSYGA